MLKSVLLSSAALAVCSTLAAAQDSVFIPGERVIVSATRIPTPASQIASSVTVIDAADIQARQQRSLPDALQDVPGLSVIQTGGTGGQTSLFMRGSNANHTKVLIDGIDVSDPTTPDGATDISKFLTGGIARIEVLRGPQSGLYGSDAIGGVIALTTRSGEGPTTLSGTLEGGSFDTFNQAATLGGSSGDFHFAATLDHLHAGATPVTPLNLLLPGEKRNDDYFDGFNATAKLGLDLGHDFDLGLVAWTGSSLGRLTGDAFSLATFTSYPSPLQTRRYTQQYAGRATAHWSGWWLDQILGLAYSSTVTSNRDPDNGDSFASGSRIKLDWQGHGDLAPGQILVLGAESGRDALRLPLSTGYTTNAGYAELQSSWGSVSNSASLRYDDNSKYGGHLTWRLAPAWVVGGTKLKASIGTGFKAPSLEQLFESFPAFHFSANPNLKPETSLGYDAGIEQSLGDFRGGASWFHNDIKNLIAGNATFTTDINLGKAKTQGVEAFAAWQASDAVSLRADYTYTDAIDSAAHHQLLRRPRNKASLTAAWRATADLDVNASLFYVGPQIDGNRDFSIPRLKLSGYAIVNLAASWRIEDRFTLFGRVENAFDTHYQSPDGFLRPGIGAYAGIRANL